MADSRHSCATADRFLRVAEFFHGLLWRHPPAGPTTRLWRRQLCTTCRMSRKSHPSSTVADSTIPLTSAPFSFQARRRPRRKPILTYRRDPSDSIAPAPALSRQSTAARIWAAFHSGQSPRSGNPGTPARRPRATAATAAVRAVAAAPPGTVSSSRPMACRPMPASSTCIGNSQPIVGDTCGARQHPRVPTS